MFNRRSNKNIDFYLKSRTAKPLFVGASLALVALIGAFALCSNFKVENTNAATNNAAFAVQLGEVLTLSAPSTVILNDCNPSTSNLCTADADITVSSNFANGYKLYMNAANGSSTSLNNASAGTNIPTVSTAYSSSNFPINSWGYTGGTDQTSASGLDCTTNYCPVLAYQSEETAYAPNRLIASANEPTATTTKTITFGAKVDATKASGTYVTSVVFTAIGTPATVSSLTDGLFLQDVTPSTCAGTTTTDVTYDLIDARDFTHYTVSKLKDGNCWMTQNLELGQYGTPMNLTSDTSNVSPNGGYTLTLPYENNSVYKGNSNHYGNYYNWNTATAGSGTSTVGEDAPYSICPKNWRLPHTTTVETNSEYYTLLDQNYITTGTWNNDGFWTGVTTSQFTNAPVSLVFSGYMGSSGTLDFQSSRGYWWSSTSNGSSNAFALGVYTNGYVDPNYNYGRPGGFAVRCLVPSS